MTLTEIHFMPKLLVRFSAEEITTMITYSRQHYDGACQKLSEPGGFLFGLQNCLDAGGTGFAEWELSSRDLDILGKTLEREVGPLYWAVSKLFTVTQREYKKTVVQTPVEQLEP
jgi:hypothetical protein